MIRRIALYSLVLLIMATLVIALSASEKPGSPVAIDIVYDVTTVERGNVGLRLEATGEGTISDDTTVKIYQVIVVKIDIDHTSAGVVGGTTGSVVFSGEEIWEFRGAVKGSITGPSNGSYYISMSVKGIIENGGKMTQELHGVFNKDTGIFELEGTMDCTP